jgi:gas vesicle protein
MGTKLGFFTGAAIGASVVFLTSPRDGEGNREWLRLKTDELAAGDSLVGSVVRSVRGFIEDKQARVQLALEAGRREAERHEAELWQQLKLPPPE